MFNWKGLEGNAMHVDGFAFRHDPALGDRIGGQQWQYLGCRIDGTRRAICESPDVIRVSVRDDNCGRPQRLDPTEPVSATIDEDTGIRRFYEERAVAAMPPRFLLDATAGAKKDEVHATTSHLIIDRPL
jgi:hypothetical protein